MCKGDVCMRAANRLYLRVQGRPKGEVRHSPLFHSFHILTLCGSYWDDSLHLGDISEHLGSFLHLIPKEKIDLQPLTQVSDLGAAFSRGHLQMHLSHSQTRALLGGPKCA